MAPLVDEALTPAEVFFAALDHMTADDAATAVATLTVISDFALVQEMARRLGATLKQAGETDRVKAFRQTTHDLGHRVGQAPWARRSWEHAEQVANTKWARRTRERAEQVASADWARRTLERAEQVASADWARRSRERLEDLWDVVGPRARHAWKTLLPDEDLDTHLTKAVAVLRAEPATELHKSLVTALSKRLHLPEPTSHDDADWYRKVLSGIGAEYGVDAQLSDRSLARRVIQSILTETLTRFQEGANTSAEQEDQFLDQLEEGLATLTPAQQHDLATTIGAEDLTRDSLRDALKTGALVTAVEAGLAGLGGALFIFATSMLHATATLFGVGLSFGAYTALTHGLAIVMGPFGIVVGAAAMELARRRYSRRLDRRVSALVLLQVLSNSANAAIEADQPDDLSQIA